MTNLTPFQAQQAETIWLRMDEAQAQRGSLLAALQERLGGVADFFERFFADDADIDAVLTAMLEVTYAFDWDLQALATEAQKVDVFEAIDAEVKANGGDAADADIVQNNIVEQHWLAMIAELRHLGAVNEMPEIAQLGDNLEANNARLLGALAG